MATDDEQLDEGRRGTWPEVGGGPAKLPFDQRDYGDAEQLAELTGADEPAGDEPLAVDEPVRIPPPD
ncbi:hypothetical protein [Micromonospora siamensis]|uniref:Uncharacterized protein n=1 Tax=Micromonospora siamensis TaxID=299152 RepID=A0A1C5GLK7_9ACTN|nr:hypothetical protein [Micromonospora siamensis]SCG34698.1 hypothetical protein GA0074704_0114 [Micromonospora siamensis]